MTSDSTASTIAETTLTEAGGGPPPQAAAPGPISMRPGALFAALVALWLAMNEISLLSSGFLPTRGSPWSFNGMTGPFGPWQLTDWHVALDGVQLGHWKRLLAGYVVLDALFITGYVLAAFRHTSSGSWVRKFIVAIAAADVAETIGLLVLGMLRCKDDDCVPGSLTYFEAVFTALKWAGILLLVAGGLIACFRYWSGTRRFVRLLGIQRFSLLAFLPIAALATIPGSSVFDQLPDVHRRWLDDRIGVKHAALAGLIYVLVVFVLFLLGRIRADWALRRVLGNGYWPYYADEDKLWPRRPTIWLWVLGPLLLLGLGVVIALAGGGRVFWPRLLVFCAIPLLIVFLSRLAQGSPLTEPRELRPTYPGFPRQVMAVGDVLSVAALSLAGLGMIRAFTGLAALESVDLLDSSYAVDPRYALLAGVVLAIGPWFIAGPLLTRVEAWGQPAYPVGKRFRRLIGRLAMPGVSMTPEQAVSVEPRTVFRFILLAASAGGFLAWAFFARPVAGAIGVLAATLLSLTTLVIMLAVVVAYAQERQPVEIFQRGPTWLKPRVTPIITLLVVTLALTGFVGGKTDIHPVDAGGNVPARPTMERAFQDWVKQPDGCAVPVSADGFNELTLRPMLLMAAEGGGIRATYWTAAALQKIGEAGGGCGRRAAFFSSGASGGALGLTIGRFTDQPLAAVQSIAGHEALGAATISLLSGDLLASATGLRVDSHAAERVPDRQPLDRSGLMETAWEHETALTGLRTPFLPASLDAATSGNGAVTGQLILNSTAARDGCIALLSQVDLSADTELGRTPVCGTGAAGAHNYDLFGAYGRTATSPDERCLGDFPALTGGLLASRFPYITPSGIVAGCRDLKSAQLVDGGYTDNTGLSTILDLRESWQDLVRMHNDEVIANGTGTFVVPMVVYIENGTGPNFSTGKNQPQKDHRLVPGQPGDKKIDWMQVPESVVPPVAKWYTAKDNTTDSLPLLDEAGQAVREKLCTDGDQCKLLSGNSRIQHQVFVIHQSTQPALSAPLGWVLSASSQKDLNDDLDLQATHRCEPNCNTGYATLLNLVTTLTPSAEQPR